MSHHQPHQHQVVLVSEKLPPATKQPTPTTTSNSSSSCNDTGAAGDEVCSDIYVVAAELMRNKAHRQLLRYLTAERHSLDIDEVDEQGQTLLHHAASCGSSKCAQVLLEFGSRVDHADNDRNTPLHCAYRHRRIPAIVLLLRNGAMETLRNAFGQVPRETASSDEFKVRNSTQHWLAVVLP